MNTNRLPRIKYFQPKTIDQTLKLKEEAGSDAVIMAGGTDLVPLLKRRNISPKRLINIKGIPRLHRISYDEKDGLRVGAAVTLRDVAEHPVVSEKYPVLAKAALSVAYNQIRNMGTLVGNICLDNKCGFFNQSAFWWQSRPDCFKRGGDRCYVVKGGKQCYALSAGDTVSPLIALEATLSIIGPEGEREMPVEDFYTGEGRHPHNLEERSFVTGVRIPPPNPGWRDRFLKKSLRGSVDFAIATLSLRLKNNGRGLEGVRITLNGVSPKPVKAVKTEQFLLERGISQETVPEAARLLLTEITPVSSIGASVFLRRHMIQAMFSDAIEMISEETPQQP